MDEIKFEGSPKRGWVISSGKFEIGACCSSRQRRDCKKMESSERECKREESSGMKSTEDLIYSTRRS